MIVAARATGQVSDKGLAVAMTRETIPNTGETPRELSAAAGYYSAQAVAELEALGVDPYIAPERTRHGTRPEPAPRGRIPKGLSARERMRRKLRTKRGRERYALRMETAEPVFGQIKRDRGLRQFLLRGLEKVNREWSLICTRQNLMKLFRFGAGLHVRGRTHGPAGAAGELRRAIITLMTGRLALCEYSTPVGTAAVPWSAPTSRPLNQSSDGLLGIVGRERT